MFVYAVIHEDDYHHQHIFGIFSDRAVAEKHVDVEALDSFGERHSVRYRRYIEVYRLDETDVDRTKRLGRLKHKVKETTKAALEQYTNARERAINDLVSAECMDPDEASYFK